MNFLSPPSHQPAPSLSLSFTIFLLSSFLLFQETISSSTRNPPPLHTIIADHHRDSRYCCHATVGTLFVLFLLVLVWLLFFLLKFYLKIMFLWFIVVLIMFRNFKLLFYWLIYDYIIYVLKNKNSDLIIMFKLDLNY